MQKDYKMLCAELDEINLTNLTDINDETLKTLEDIVNTLETMCLSCKDLNDLNEQKYILDKVNLITNNLAILFDGWWNKFRVDVKHHETLSLVNSQEKFAEIRRQLDEYIYAYDNRKDSSIVAGGFLASLVFLPIAPLIIPAAVGLAFHEEGKLPKSEFDIGWFKKFSGLLLTLHQRINNLQLNLAEVLKELNALINAKSNVQEHNRHAKGDAKPKKVKVYLRTNDGTRVQVKKETK